MASMLIEELRELLLCRDELNCDRSRVALSYLRFASGPSDLRRLCSV